MNVAETVRTSLRETVLERTSEFYLAVALDTAEVVDANEAVRRALGYGRSDLSGMGIAEVTGVADASTWRASVPESGETLEGVEYDLRGADEEVVPTGGSLSRTATDDGEYVVALLHELP